MRLWFRPEPATYLTLGLTFGGGQAREEGKVHARRGGEFKIKDLKLKIQDYPDRQCTLPILNLKS